VQDLADTFLRKGWGLDKNAKLPPYISVHIRRTGEFGHRRVMGWESTTAE
jgi:hypothetical protein